MTTNSVNCWGSLVTSIRPPCRLTMMSCDREAEACTFAGRFGREEWIENLFLHLRWDTGAIVANAYFDLVLICACAGSNQWFEVATAIVSHTTGHRMEPVRDQVEQNAGDLLGK